jgi:hypothetical protein
VVGAGRIYGGRLGGLAIGRVSSVGRVGIKVDLLNRLLCILRISVFDGMAYFSSIFVFYSLLYSLLYFELSYAPS